MAAAAAGADFESGEVAQKGGVVLVGHLAGGIEKVYLKGQVVGAAKRFVYRAGEGAGQGWQVDLEQVVDPALKGVVDGRAGCVGGRGGEGFDHGDDRARR